MQTAQQACLQCTDVTEHYFQPDTKSTALIATAGKTQGQSDTIKKSKEGRVVDNFSQSSNPLENKFSLSF